ncbi:MAG: monovalent cation/H(+) antiporter subunit G [Candidatus Methanomethylicus sp.]|nr:monovalent cation/H(+) antiporter subunit G [Candidatus Methanomethylicus sp.]
MWEAVFVLTYAAVVMGYTAWNIKKGSFVIDPSQLILFSILGAIVIIAILTMASGDFFGAAEPILKLGAAALLFAGIPPMLAAGVGYIRFGEEYGPNIFYARNHITGVIDTVASLVMIFVGILIYRLDLAAVGFFFFLLIPFTGNALANAYYYSYQRRLGK